MAGWWSVMRKKSWRLPTERNRLRRLRDKGGEEQPDWLTEEKEGGQGRTL